MMRPYEWGSLTQEIGRRPTNIDDPVNGGNRNGIAERGCRGLGSYHDWFEERGPRCVHMGYIDNTAREMFGRFYDDEP
jgi:hypothetical protein